jgi:hypothetical protein
MDSAIHLGQIKTPVGNTDDRDLGMFEDLVQHLEGKVRRLFRQTDFIKKDDRFGVGGAFLGLDGVIKDLEDSFSSGERGALVREDQDGRKFPEGRVGGVLAIEVGADDLHCQGL